MNCSKNKIILRGFHPALKNRSRIAQGALVAMLSMQCVEASPAEFPEGLNIADDISMYGWQGNSGNWNLAMEVFNGGASLVSGVPESAPWAKDGGVLLAGQPVQVYLGAVNSTQSADGRFEIFRGSNYGVNGALPLFGVDSFLSIASFNNLNVSVNNGTLSVAGSPVITAASAPSALASQGFLQLSNGILVLSNSTVSSSSTTGALTVAGGVGIAKDSWITGLRIGTGKNGKTGNTALGKNVLGNTSTTSGDNNTAIGSNVLSLNTTGYQNTGVGADALKATTSGFDNTASGYLALAANSSGSGNLAGGAYALAQNTIASNNTALGYMSSRVNTSGEFLTSVGSMSLRSNTTGHRNTAMGYVSMYSNTTGARNTAVGPWSLYSNTTGNYNTAIGIAAGQYQANGTTALTDPENSVYIGANSRGKDNLDSNSIVIGANAIGEGANTTVIGNIATVSTRLFGETKTSSLRISGQVIMDQAQGDISMGIYGN